MYAPVRRQYSQKFSDFFPDDIFPHNTLKVLLFGLWRILETPIFFRIIIKVQLSKRADDLTYSEYLDLVCWDGLPVQRPLYRHRTVLADSELPSPVRGPVYGIRHLAVAAPIRVCGAEFFQG